MFINNDPQRIMIIANLVAKFKQVFRVNSIKVIIKLFDMLNRNKISLLPLSIKYTNSERIDEGGLTCSFISA